MTYCPSSSHNMPAMFEKLASSSGTFTSFLRSCSLSNIGCSEFDVSIWTRQGMCQSWGDLDDTVVIGFQGLGENILGFRDFLDFAETLEKVCWFFSWDCFSICR
jgi:hypothetical protein